MTTEFTQARIRVSREGALILVDALEMYESMLIQDRLNPHATAGTRSQINAELKDLRRVIDETTRTIKERGWDEDNGELQQPDEA